MKKIFRLSFFAFAALFINSCGDSGTEEVVNMITLPTVDTAPVKTMTLGITTEIFPTSAVFRGSIVQPDGQGETPGFVYSTSPNPTVSNNPSVYTLAQGSTNFEAKSGTLQPNTTYYVRGYIKKSEGIYIYTSESTFKTTGYYGPAGGYVGYDKGEYTNGWRYMEIHPTTLNYSSGGVGGQWGTMGTFISGTYPDFGKGLENTNIIIAANPGANCAAKLCKNLTLNGKSDWFLPSSQELLTLYHELKKGNISISSNAWSSTQSDGNSAYSIYYQTFGLPTPEVVLSTTVKSYATNILPARRY